MKTKNWGDKVKPIHILIADDQPIFCDGLAAILEINDNFRVIAKAYNGKEAMEKAKEYQPDIVLMDIRMPNKGGLIATKEIKQTYPHIIIVMLTTFSNDAYILQAIKNGANGYLLKDSETDQIIRSIRDSLSGQMIIPSSVHSVLVDHLNNNDYDKSTDYLYYQLADKNLEFTKTEYHILKLLISGKKNKEIAQELYLSIGTVKNYVSQIYKKLDVRTRTEAILLLKEL